jgi:hypothetical protein
VNLIIVEVVPLEETHLIPMQLLVLDDASKFSNLILWESVLDGLNVLFALYVIDVTI